MRWPLYHRLIGMGFAAPAFLLLVLLHLVPLVVLAVLSLTDYQFGSLTMRFVGLGTPRQRARRSGVPALAVQHLYLCGDRRARLGRPWPAAGNPRSRPGPSRGVYEVIFFLPVTATLIAMASVWKFLLHPTLGPINAVIVALGFQPVNFLSDPAVTLPTLAVIGIWQLVGFNTALFLAGLSTIPRDLYEAADIFETVDTRLEQGDGDPLGSLLNTRWCDDRKIPRVSGSQTQQRSAERKPARNCT